MQTFYKVCLILMIIGGINWGLVGLFQFVPQLAMTLPAGHVVDRLHRGRVFAAWSDAHAGALPALQREQNRWRGVAVVEGEYAAGINALGAPVFDAQGQLLLALTLVGPAASLPADADGEAAQALRAACQRISAALGWQGP